MAREKATPRSNGYGGVKASTSRRTPTIVTDFDLFVALACAALVLAFGGCMVHWAVCS